MPIIQAVKSLNAGKFSPLLRARDEYVASCKTLKNFIPTVQGPLQRRAGTRYVADITGAVRLLPFVFSPLQRYLFVFYENKIDVMNGETVVKTLQTTYKAADIPNLFYTQAQDVMFLAHADYPMKKITRTIGANNAADFKIEDVAFKNGPYLDENITDTTISVAGTTATASANLFSANDIGRWIHVETVDNGATKCLDAKISAVPSATTATLTDLNGEFHSGKATKMWRMSPFSASNGYPESVCYHQERLWVAKAGRIYAACQAGGVDFSIKKADATVLETNGFSVNMAVEKGADIYWLVSADMLTVGTLSFEYGITSSTLGLAVTPSNKKAVKAFDVGTCSLKPELTDDGIVFTDTFRRSIYFLRYSQVYETYEKSDLTKFNPDITRGKIKETAFCAKKTPILWACKKDGSRIGCTLSIRENVVAWFDADVSGKVVSLCSLPNIDQERDSLFLAVERNVNGIKKTYLETLSDGLPDGDRLPTNSIFVDCAVVIDKESPQTVIDGLGHLEGQTVDILADGGVQPSQVVSNGSVNLQSAAKHVIVGIGYESVVEPSSLIPSVNKERTFKHISNIEVMLLDTLGGKAGVEAVGLNTIQYYTGTQKMNAPVPLFSGIKQISTGGHWSKDATVRVVQDMPLPMTIQALYVTMEVV